MKKREYKYMPERSVKSSYFYDERDFIEVIDENQRALSKIFDMYILAKTVGNEKECELLDGQMFDIMQDMKTHPWAEERLNKLMPRYKKIHENH